MTSRYLVPDMMFFVENLIEFSRFKFYVLSLENGTFSFYIMAGYCI
jgi:hypothetical protein